MTEHDDREREPRPDEPDPPEEDSWKEEARRWYEELQGQEGSIAPWLNLEWTGDRMKVNRG